jgi:hypothetical protein
MARGKANGTVPARERWQFKGYLSCDFVATDKMDVREWIKGRTDEDLLGDIALLVEDGYKLSVGPTSRGINATLANYEGPEAYRGYMLSAFAADATTALHALVYKHLVLLKRDWGDVTPSENDLLR